MPARLTMLGLGTSAWKHAKTNRQRQGKNMVQQLQQNIENNQQPPPTLEQLLERCVVKLTVPPVFGHGTGFFVAPGLILTCAHVVKAATPAITVSWQQQTYQAIVVQCRNDSAIDLALLQLLAPMPLHPCVLCEAALEQRDALSTYGYPDDYPDGAPATFEAEGITASDRLIKFKGGQVRSGLSGAPLLNLRTGKVCGVIKSTRSSGSDLGGGAVPMQTVLSEFAELRPLQNQVQSQNSQWMQRIQCMIAGDIHLLQSSYGVVAHQLLAEQMPHITIDQPRFKLRQSFPGLLDRQSECDRLLTALEQHHSAEIYAAAGSGKTTLLEYLGDRSQTAAFFPHGILYHRWSAATSVNDLLQIIFDRFCHSETAIKATPGIVQRYLQNQQALILLDDADLPQDDLKSLMTSLPDCTFLVASSARRLIGETVTPVGLTGLPLPDAIALIERALQRSLTPSERPAAEALYTLLQGHPGSILQIVTSVNQQRSLIMIVQDLQTTPLIRQVLMSLEKRQRWLVALLAALGTILLARHANALTPLSETESVFKSLVKRHIVVVEGDRYRLADNISQAMQLYDLEAWRSRALGYFSEWVKFQEPASILADQSLLLRLLDWAVDTGHWEEALSLVRSLDPVLFSSGQWDAWQHVLQHGLQIAQVTGDVATEAWILHQLGTRALGLQETELAQQYLTDAMELRQSSGDAIGASITQHNLQLLLLPIPAPESSDPSTPLVSPLDPKLWLWLVGAIAVILTAFVISRIFWPITNHGESPSPTVSTNSPVSPIISPTFSPDVTPPIPTNFSAQVLTATEASLSWRAANNTNQFKIERSVDNGANYQQIATIPAGATTTIDRSLTPNTTYFYRIRAFDPDTSAHSSYSNPIQITTPAANSPIQTPRLVELTLPRQIAGGNSSRGRLRLNQPALAGGVSIQLESDSRIVAIPAQITIAAGEIEASFAIRTSNVSTTTSVTLTATQQGSTNTQVARILITTSPTNGSSTERETESPQEASPNPAPASLQTFTLTANSLEGGAATSGIVQLNNPASTDGVRILIESSNSNVATPDSVTIPAGASSIYFDVETITVQAVEEAIITVSDQQGNVRSQTLRLEPPPPPADLAASIEFNILQQGRFSGVVQITGYVTNIGAGTFALESGSAIAVLYENNQAVSRMPLESIASGNRVSVEYTREWNASSPAEGEFPPIYKLVIDNANDSNPGNDTAERSGSEINQRFSTQPNNSDTGVILRPNIDLDSNILQQPPDSPIK